jgi:hypothetical protein
VNLETVGEQRAVLDHVLVNLARLEDMSQQAQGTLKSLQTERALAERIEQGIRSQKGRPGLGEDKKRA